MSEKQPTILLTNDDGIDSRGLQVLADSLEGFGKVVVVAPDREQSTTSHSLTLHRPLRVKKISEDHFAVDGTPTDCVYLGIRSILQDRKPSLVVSGINRGANLGDDVTYSGTVAAALEGTLLGVPSVAFSVVGTGNFKFETVASVVPKIVANVLSDGLPADTLLNVNSPNVELDEIQGIQITTLGKHRYEEVVTVRKDPRGRPYYWLGGEDEGIENIEGTDGSAILQNCISVTPLHLDMTNYEALASLRNWDL